ncbi:hypothetical protein FRB99_006950 [Tulasnella sp. 403]|nr:hypothetical protein FRB99_006950 [Tulasnella sp. 403]
MPPTFNLHVLKEFATRRDPKTLPPSTLLKFSPSTITVFDKYPKATFHFLVLPRVDKDAGRTPSVLHDLRSLLQHDKEAALEILRDLESESREVERMVLDEMQKRFGFQWKVYVGFHAVPTLYHVHLHIISGDFVSPWIKSKKHWNSFNPKHGFFLDLKEILSWYDLPEETFKKRIQLPPALYDPVLKLDLQCSKCEQGFTNMPKLKEHLQTHFERELAAAMRKRKHEIDLTREDEGDEETARKSSWQESSAGPSGG